MKTMSLKARIVLAVMTVVLALSSVACTDGDNIMSDNSNAKRAYNYALCIKNAGDNVEAAKACKP